MLCHLCHRQRHRDIGTFGFQECEGCGERFGLTRKAARFCKTKCRMDYHYARRVEGRKLLDERDRSQEGSKR